MCKYSCFLHNLCESSYKLLNFNDQQKYFVKYKMVNKMLKTLFDACNKYNHFEKDISKIKITIKNNLKKCLLECDIKSIQLFNKIIKTAENLDDSKQLIIQVISILFDYYTLFNDSERCFDYVYRILLLNNIEKHKENILISLKNTHANHTILSIWNIFYETQYQYHKKYSEFSIFELYKKKMIVINNCAKIYYYLKKEIDNIN